MATNQKQSGFSLWYEDYLQGRALPIIGLGGGALMVLLYFTGVIPEWIAALLLAAGIVLGACGYAFKHLFDAARTSGETAMALGLTILVAIVAGIPVVTTLLPGTPRAEGNVHAAGETIKLPADARGSVRILLHGRVAGSGTADADIVLAVGDQHLSGHFSRKPQSVRIGRRGRGTVMREHNSQFLITTIPDDVDQIKVESVKGKLAEPIAVQVFPDFLPTGMELGLGLTLLVLGSALAARFGANSNGPGALGLTLLFAVMIHRIATPEIAIQPEMGSLVIGGVGGLLAGSISTWVMKKIVHRRPEPTAAMRATT